MEDINLLLSYVEAEVKDGKKPFMGNGVIVNGENILNLVKRIRISLSNMDGTAILADANEQAQKIISQAESMKAKMLDADINIRDAQVIAEGIINDAFDRKAQVEENMRRNVVNMLNQVKLNLKNAGISIDKTIEQINEKPL